MIINEKMSLLELVQRYPQTVEVFHNYGMGCLGCSAARFESIEEGALAQGIDVDNLIKSINDAIDAVDLTK